MAIGDALRSENLSFIPMSVPKHVAFVGSVRWHPGVSRYMIASQRPTEEEQKEWGIAAIKDENQFVWVVHGCFPMGYVSLKITPEHRRAEIGIAILPDFHRHGHGKEAIKTITAWAHGTIERVEALCFAWNHSAMMAFQSAEYIWEGTLRHYIIKNDKPVSMTILSHLRDE